MPAHLLHSALKMNMGRTLTDQLQQKNHLVEQSSQDTLCNNTFSFPVFQKSTLILKSLEHYEVWTLLASSRGETKYSALLSSRDRYLLEPVEWPKGSKASCEVWKKTRDCSPGQAGKEVPNLAMTVGFPELRRQCGVSHEV